MEKVNSMFDEMIYEFLEKSFNNGMTFGYWLVYEDMYRSIYNDREVSKELKDKLLFGLINAYVIPYTLEMCNNKGYYYNSIDDLRERYSDLFLDDKSLSYKK